MLREKFIKNWSLLTISNIVQQGLNFIVIIPIARYLEPLGFGQFTVVLTIIGIAQVISSLGLRQIVIREVARDHSKISMIARESISLLFIATIITCGLIIFDIFYIENIHDSVIIILSVLLLLSQVLWNFVEPLAFGKEQMELSSYIGIISSIMWLVCIFLLPRNQFSLKSILWLYVTIQLLKALVYISIAWKRKYFDYKNRNRQNEHPGKLKLLKQSLPLYGTGLLTIPISQLPILLLSKYSGDSEVAYFNIGSKLAIPFTLIAGTLLNTIYPILSRKFTENKNMFNNYFNLIFIVLSVSGVIFCFIFSLFSREIIVLFFGMKYISAIQPFVLLLWVTLNLVLHNFLGTIFLAANKESLMVKLSVFNAIVIGSANFMGSHWGALGLAISSLISLIIGFGFHWYFLIKRIQLVINKNDTIIIFVAYIILSSTALFYFNYSLLLKIFLSILIICCPLIYLRVIKNIRLDDFKSLIFNEN